MTTSDAAALESALDAGGVVRAVVSPQKQEPPMKTVKISWSTVSAWDLDGNRLDAACTRHALREYRSRGACGDATFANPATCDHPENYCPTVDWTGFERAS